LAAVLALAACGGATPQPAGSPSAQGPGPQQAAPQEQQYDEYGYPIPSTSPSPKPQPVAQAPAPQPQPQATPPPPVGPVAERAHQLREAADLLDKAEAARGRDAKSFAEQLFSSAELIVGADALADLAPRFRAGAPPRVTEPTKPVTDTAPQPIAEGDSDKDRPEVVPPKAAPTRGSVTGTVQMDGKAFAGEMAVVTLEPIGKKKPPTIPTARVIEQRNRQFAPRVLVVPVGSLVSFPNFDPTFHNVFSTSGTKPFDLGLYKTNQTREVLFDKEGVVRLACNLHANMSAFIVVMSAPHYTITDGGGRFKFKSIAPGKYLARVYSDRATRPVDREVEIKAGRNELDLGVTGDAPSGPLPDKFGVARGAKTP
jgi:plastocyanin